MESFLLEGEPHFSGIFACLPHHHHAWIMPAMLALHLQLCIPLYQSCSLAPFRQKSGRTLAPHLQNTWNKLLVDPLSVGFCSSKVVLLAALTCKRDNCWVLLWQSKGSSFPVFMRMLIRSWRLCFPRYSHLLKAFPLNTITLATRFQYMNLRHTCSLKPTRKWFYMI